MSFEKWFCDQFEDRNGKRKSPIHEEGVVVAPIGGSGSSSPFAAVIPRPATVVTPSSPGGGAPATSAPTGGGGLLGMGTLTGSLMGPMSGGSSSTPTASALLGGGIARALGGSVSPSTPTTPATPLLKMQLPATAFSVSKHLASIPTKAGFAPSPTTPSGQESYASKSRREEAEEIAEAIMERMGPRLSAIDRALELAERAREFISEHNALAKRDQHYADVREIKEQNREILRRMSQIIMRLPYPEDRARVLEVLLRKAS